MKLRICDKALQAPTERDSIMSFLIFNMQLEIFMSNIRLYLRFNSFLKSYE